MTPVLFFSRLRTYLKTMAWVAAPQGKIFGDSVYIVSKIPIEQIAAYRPPVAFIVDGGAAIDNNHPGLIQQSFSISIFVQNVQDHMGESVMLGANRAAGTSEGAGLLDIEEEMINQIIDVTVLTTKVMLVEKGLPSATVARGNNPAVFRTIKFSVLLSLY
uniref:Uncharacterized protein n=2 Tax=viral metagenome TaxID=1070528 RepID=A0A6H1ZG31_9ZZZZ